MGGNKNLFIVIVTYNGMSWIDTCLKSCEDYLIIVVDNASNDETVSFIISQYPKVTLIKQNENLGFGQANNIGIRYALDHGAEQVFLLNQDAYLVDVALDQLVSFQKQNPDYGILSPIHITGNQKKLDKNFSNFMLKEKSGQFYSDFVLGNPLASVYDVPFVNAAAWLVSKKCLETVGGFDPLFFHYGEDDNYCQRAIYHGFKIGVLPQIFVIHDREERVEIKPTVFSPEYYKTIEKAYKIRYADINSAERMDLKVKKLQETILKLRLKFKFKRAAEFKKELTLLLRMKTLIEKSRETNKTIGAHYL